VAVTYDLYHVDLREKDMGEYVASIVLIPAKGKKTWEGRALNEQKDMGGGELNDLMKSTKGSGLLRAHIVVPVRPSSRPLGLNSKGSD